MKLEIFQPWIEILEKEIKRIFMNLIKRNLYKVKVLSVKRFPNRTWNYFHKEKVAFVSK
jgi:hypothetical protein